MSFFVFEEWRRRRALQRRLAAVEELDRLWRSWRMFLRYLHKEPPEGPIALAEAQFSEVVYFHKRMVS